MDWVLLLVSWKVSDFYFYLTSPTRLFSFSASIFIDKAFKSLTVSDKMCVQFRLHKLKSNFISFCQNK